MEDLRTELEAERCVSCEALDEALAARKQAIFFQALSFRLCPLSSVAGACAAWCPLGWH